jgi:glycine amidinotransferase
MNVLSVDEERVMVDDQEPELIAELERRGFTPIPCRWRHGRLIGGGFHCMTLDVRRNGDLEDYAR